MKKLPISMTPTFFVYEQASFLRKCLYWMMTGASLVLALFFTWYILSSHPLEPPTPPIALYGAESSTTYEIAYEYLLERASITAQKQVRNLALTMAWVWELYLLFTRCIVLTQRKLRWEAYRKMMLGPLIGSTNVIFFYLAYMMSF